MKKTTVLILTLTAVQALQIHAWSVSNSSSQVSNSAVNAVSSSTEGGTVHINGKTYDLEPGQTLQYSGGNSLSSSTVQEPGKEPVTTTVLHEQEPTVLINGKPADDVSENPAAGLDSGILAVYKDGQLISSTEPETPTELESVSAEEAVKRFNEAELDAEIEAYLDFGDGYES